MDILLKDVLEFDNLKKEYPDRRIKLRFNKYKEYEDRTYDFVEWYKEDKESKKFKDSLLTVWSRRRKRIQDNDIIFQFIEISYHKWLLVDVAKILSTNNNIAEAETLKKYERYFGKLSVEFTNLPKQFYYIDSKIIDNIKIFEITNKPYLEMEEKFCGYENVSKTYKDLAKIIEEPIWKESLKNVYGVYVITDLKTGKLYVGSATGEEGIFGRWRTYLSKGYDEEEEKSKDYPNKGLKEIVKNNGLDYIKNNFQYSILEIFIKNKIGAAKALEREKYWKNLLDSHSPHGYNYN